MGRPSRFEIMRRNRKRRVSVTAAIDGIESDVDREWAEHRRRLQAERLEQLANTREWLASTRNAVLAKHRPRRRRRGWLLWLR